MGISPLPKKKSRAKAEKTTEANSGLSKFFPPFT